MGFRKGTIKFWKGTLKIWKGQQQKLEGNSKKMEGNSKKSEGNRKKLEGNIKNLEGNNEKPEGQKMKSEGNIESWKRSDTCGPSYLVFQSKTCFGNSEILSSLPGGGNNVISVIKILLGRLDQSGRAPPLCSFFLSFV